MLTKEQKKVANPPSLGMLKLRARPLPTSIEQKCIEQEFWMTPWICIKWQSIFVKISINYQLFLICIYQNDSIFFVVPIFLIVTIIFWWMVKKVRTKRSQGKFASHGKVTSINSRMMDAVKDFQVRKWISYSWSGRILWNKITWAWHGTRTRS